MHPPPPNLRQVPPSSGVPRYVSDLARRVYRKHAQTCFFRQRCQKFFKSVALAVHIAKGTMGNDCQNKLASYGCANVPLNGAVSLAANSSGITSCSAFRNQFPSNTGSCGTVSGDYTQVASKRVSASGQMYTKGYTSSTATIGSDPGTLWYRQLNGSGMMFQNECKAIALMLLAHDTNLSRAYCYSQKDAVGFGFDAGQYIATCSGMCPTLSTTVCGLATCTLIGEALDDLPTLAAEAWQGFTFSTPTFDVSTLEDEDIPTWVASTFPAVDPSVLSEIASIVVELSTAAGKI